MIKSSGEIHQSVFIAQTASVVGDVTIGRGSSVWYGAVLRGDMREIKIGEQTNIQDGAVVHTDNTYPTILGDRVTVGHSAVVHGATVGDDSLIGMGAVVLSGAVIGKNSIVGAGAVVREKMEVPPNSIVLGIPAQVKGRVDEARLEHIRSFAADYIKLAEKHKKGDY